MGKCSECWSVKCAGYKLAELIISFLHGLDTVTCWRRANVKPDSSAENDVNLCVRFFYLVAMPVSRTVIAVWVIKWPVTDRIRHFSPLVKRGFWAGDILHSAEMQTVPNRC